MRHWSSFGCGIKHQIVLHKTIVLVLISTNFIPWLSNLIHWNTKTWVNIRNSYLYICIYRSAEYQNTFSRVIEMNIENLLRFNTFESLFGFLYAKIDMLLFLKCVKVRRSSLKIYFYDKIISWHYLLFKRYRNEWKVTKWFDTFY